MEIDKHQAAAVAAWARFEADVPDTLLRAISAAYGIIACSDGQLADSEILAYVRMAEGDERLGALDGAQLEHAIRALGEAMQTDVATGREKALEIVAAEKDDTRRSGLVLNAAKIAVRADTKVSQTERDALTAICQVLGVPPREHVPEA